MPKSKDVLIAHRITIGEHHQYKEGLTHSQVDTLIRQGYKVEAVQLADQSAVLAENEPSIGTRLWLWKNFVDGKPEYWAFDNAYPCYANGDPMTLGEPCGYAIVRPSTNGRPEVSDEQVADQSAVLAENEACAKAVANIPAPADDRASLYILGHAAALRSANEAIRARHK